MENPLDQFRDGTGQEDTAAAADEPPSAPAEQDAQSEGSQSPQEAHGSPDRASPAGPASPAAIVEAILFAADSPLPAAKVAQIAMLPLKTVRAAIGQLNDRYSQVGAAFRIEEIAGGFQMLTLARYRGVLERLYSARSESRLTQAAMETLAVVAYRQPVLRADIEAIRGVACGEVLRGLMEKQMIRIVGRAQVIGRPLLYGTTRRFLEVFGLASLEDLPKSEELRAPAQKSAAPPTVPSTTDGAPPETPAAPQTAPVEASPLDNAHPQETAASPAPGEGQYVPEPQPSPAPGSE
jgi:segregation and condensation protein B